MYINKVEISTEMLLYCIGVWSMLLYILLSLDIKQKARHRAQGKRAVN